LLQRLRLTENPPSGGSVGSPSVGGPSEGTSHALRKLQEKDPEFPRYDGNPDNFLA